MFRFNFSTTNESTKADCYSAENKISDTNSVEWFKANEVHQLTEHKIEDKSVQIFPCGKHLLKHLSYEHSIKYLPNDTDQDVIAEAESMHSDLVPGKYEGGMKIWECTRDLADFLLCNNIDFTGKQVLDLGCGAGLLGILTMYLGAESVDFQDYNESVIGAITMPNILLNIQQIEMNGMVPSRRFFSGDWKSFADLGKEEPPAKRKKYDFILTSETIYNPDNYKKLLAVFKEYLIPDGVIYLAAKTYYFGVGGGIKQFENMLNEEGTFKTVLCWQCSQGMWTFKIKDQSLNEWI